MHYTTDHTTVFSMRLTAEIASSIQAEAKTERRSKSQMAGILVEEALAERTKKRTAK